MKTTTRFELSQLSSLIGLAQRENNSKRRYVLVNRFQAKHVPVSPGEALALFDRLGAQVYPHFSGKKVTFIGFAETATAIGARLAVNFPGEGYYIQTTREMLPSRFSVVRFEEEHSHATQQQLYCHKTQEMLLDSDIVVFVEDEISTGKTILNFIKALEQKGCRNRFAVASLLNSMTTGHLALFQKAGVEVHALYWLHNRFEDYTFEQHEVPRSGGGEEAPSPSIRPISGKVEPRLGLPANHYKKACEGLVNAFCAQAGEPPGGRVLVLGTEECMYPAIVCAQALERQWPGTTAMVHATTRSPILPDSHPGYPLFCRNNLESLYEQGRPTFVYNLDCYDAAFVITDATGLNTRGVGQLCASLRSHGTKNISVLQWVV